MKYAPRPLRGYQEAAIALLRRSLSQGRKRPVLAAPTGFGKTRLAGEIISMARAKGTRVAFVVPAVSLVDQTVESFYRDGMTDVGVIQADHALTDWSKPIQVCSIQTVQRRGYPEAGLVMVDECHRQFAALNKWMADPDWAKVPFIGLSATPWAKGMAKHWDDLIISATTKELIDQGYLSPFRVFAPDHPDLSGVRTVAGDYHEGDLAQAMNKAPLVANIVETWLKLGEGRPTLCFAVDCAHAQSIQAQFETAGVPCGYIDAYTDISARNVIRDKFHRGEYKIVCNVGTLTTGVDWDVRCIILARPTRSEMLFVQIIGRALRTAEGKENAIILDHSDTHNRLGFVTDIVHDHLDTGEKNTTKRERKEKLPKECPSCHALRAPGLKYCPHCGFTPEKKSSIEYEEGTLNEIVRGRGTKATAPKNTIILSGNVVPLSDFYGMLKGYAISKGYKLGWAANKYREAVGVWPNHYRDALPIDPSREVASWIKSRQIAFSKGKGKYR